MTVKCYITHSSVIKKINHIIPLQQQELGEIGSKMYIGLRVKYP